MLSLISKTLKPSPSLCAITRLTLTSHILKLTPIRLMSTQRLFQLKLDPLSGNFEWIVIDEDENSLEPSQEPLLATTSYLDMLNDSYRNKAYRLAIDKTVMKPCHVLDIGAGTGLLSMMAARAMGSSDFTAVPDAKGMVTACESYLPMVKLMRKVLHLNGMKKNINVINKRSDELKVGVDIVSHADVMVSEILDSELLGEGLIPTLQHAHDTLLVENPLTVPYKATTYGQLVESTFLWKLHDLYNNEAKASDSIHLVPSRSGTPICVKQQQYAMHCDAITKEIKLLSEPFKIFEIDFWKRPDSHGETELPIKATDDGRVHAVVSWWILQLDREGTIFYSTAPRWISLPIHSSTGDWCDHWKQCVWFVPGKERIAIYGDGEWRLSMFTAIRNALQRRVQPLCFIADDSVFLTICVAHLSKTADVLSLFPGLRDKGAQYLEAVSDANGFSMDRMKVLQKRKTYLTLDDTHQKKVDLLIAEPYYYGNDGMLPWQNLRFWKERTMLDPVLSDDVLIMPCKGILKACAMSLPDLWNSRRSVRKIEGLDHSVVNTTLGACGDLPSSKEGPCLPFFIWQCGEIGKLSEVFTVMEFDFTKQISPCHGKAQVEFMESGICHGFALWIDWVIDAENKIVVSTGPDKRYWKQGVKLLASPVAVGIGGVERTGICCSTVVEASFDPSSGELNIQHTFS
ncbi:protein arginine N-methyltransferase 1.6-like isoform X2 [Pistacia vera]|uniref:protein arginine N-methyltransferase 1.6-like isoform X2 n=1 Tax=Pistacia vera TaxID=55513 RepID=UPI0012634E04|nr:protein arginine N-methyltransferase 1.6-like isoform X2 [Pistacia vera]